MNKVPLIVFGASGHARVILEMAERSGRFHIIGLLDSFKPVGEVLMNHAVLGNESMLPEIALSYPGLHIHIAIGDNDVRDRIAHHLATLCPDINFATIIDPSAIVSRTANIGPGSCVMPGAVINAHAIIGKQCIINSRAVLEHDGRMGDFSSLGPGAVAAGGASIGRSTALLAGAVLRHGISLGDHCVARTGASVSISGPDGSVFEGNPAHIVGNRNPGERYL
jgi:sugar O-acyltransferase (sialic acid O-acetyltransferase NeuD family)